MYIRTTLGLSCLLLGVAAHGQVSTFGSDDIFDLSINDLMNVKVTTGSRVDEKSPLKSVVPIDIYDESDLQLHGSGDLTEVIRNMVPGYHATLYTGDESAFIRPVFFRSMAPDSMMILMNSRRMHRTALLHISTNALAAGSHAADPGFIPAIAIKNIEVLKDGDSSQYGSDAISGVFNLLLKDRDEGAEVEVQTGQYAEGEISNRVAANVGASFAQTGFLNLSIEYTDDQQLSRGFQPASAQAAIDAGNTSVGLDSPYAGDDLAQTWGRPEKSGIRTAWNSSLPISGDDELYFFGNYANTYTNYRFFYRVPGHSSLQPVPLNPNDPSQGNFCWCDQLTGGYTPYLEGEIVDYSMVLGYKTAFADTRFDLSVGYGVNEIDITLNNTLNPSYGPNSPRDFDTGDTEQREVSLNVDLLTPLTPKLDWAYGYEWRTETYYMYAGQEESWQIGDWGQVALLIDPQTSEPYATPPVGSNGRQGISDDAAGEFDRQNYAFYSDLEWDPIDSISVLTALRYEEYSDFGNTLNGKLAGSYLLTAKSSIRSSLSTGFRAPTPAQSNYTGVWTSFDGASGQQSLQGTILPTSDLAKSLGAKALDAEKSVSFNLGYTAFVNDNFSFTIDAYQTLLRDRIVKTTDIEISNNPSFSTVSFYANALDTKTSGIELQSKYIGEWKKGARTSAKLGFNLNKQEVTDQKMVNGAEPVSDSSVYIIENSLPNESGRLSINHEVQNGWSINSRINYLGGSIDERSQREKLKSVTTVDVSFAYRIGKNYRIKIGAANLFDEYPNRIQTRVSNGLPYPRRSAYSLDGRLMYLNLSYALFK